ncbi:R-spondin-3-like [Megalops cyprinoides]|uniref:R-spondin-3-like n=1 Tax=Megalops cyprinoides TaxID=118141 RepID=UPI001864F1DA|nr:R-spondin-3-like [Megalops cyprinoides]
MRLQLLSLVLTLQCVEFTNCQQHASSQHKQITGGNTGCPGGCQTCSDDNGCMTCKPRLFFFVERKGMREIGVCLHACPSSYYGVRSPDINTCQKCKVACDSCFNMNFCTRCSAGYYLHWGRCQKSCPEGLFPSDPQRECIPDCAKDCETCMNSTTCARCRVGLYLLSGKCHHVCPEEFETNDQLMECTPPVHCEVGEWGSWSPCSRRERTCGFKRGEETRTREVLQLPSPRGDPCPITSERKKCVITRKKCPGRQKGGEQKDVTNGGDRESEASWHDQGDREMETQDSGQDQGNAEKKAEDDTENWELVTKHPN